MGLSLPHILLLALVVLLLFGGGRVSGLMGDVAKGIKSFKKGLSDDDDASRPPSNLEGNTPPKVIEVEKQTDKSL